MPDGKMIKAGRVLAGLSGKQLADLLGVNHTVIVRLEADADAARLDVYKRVLTELEKAGVVVEETGVWLKEKGRGR
jgi:predicted transcriptional regulator